VPAGDAQRVWFPEMIQKLRAEWHVDMFFPDLIGLRDSLGSILRRIRLTGGINPPLFKCPACGKIRPASEPRVSVRAMILSLARFQIAETEHPKMPEQEWAVYRKKNQLDLYAKAVTSESRANDCDHSNVR
jgi:hypothetical protein